jgi:hypothetical protein
MQLSKTFSALLFFLVMTGNAFSQNNDKGLVLQKLTKEQIDAIHNPVEGMVIYNLNDKKPQFYNGSSWRYFDFNGHYVGERYGGGIVFYIDSTGEHGMIVAPDDQKSSQWGTFEKELGAHGKSIGTGKSNTEIIEKAYSKPDIAGTICSSLELNGYTDWYLPSVEELNIIYLSIKSKGLGNFANDAYWSSSETDFNNAWILNFGNGYPIENNVNKTYHVRAVRNF